MKNDYQTQTAFLEEIIQFDHTQESHTFQQRFTQAQREERCMRRAVWWVARLAGFAIVGLVYARLLLGDFFEHNDAKVFLDVLWVLALGSVVCLLNFIGLWVVYRHKLNLLRDECRRLVVRLLQRLPMV